MVKAKARCFVCGAEFDVEFSKKGCVDVKCPKCGQRLKVCLLCDKVHVYGVVKVRCPRCDETDEVEFDVEDEVAEEHTCPFNSRHVVKVYTTDFECMYCASMFTVVICKCVMKMMCKVSHMVSFSNSFHVYSTFPIKVS